MLPIVVRVSRNVALAVGAVIVGLAPVIPIHHPHDMVQETCFSPNRGNINQFTPECLEQLQAMESEHPRVARAVLVFQ